MNEPRDRGAVLPLVALVMTTLIAFASIAVDLGFERVARRDMQALADVVALDLSRRLDGRTVSQLSAEIDSTGAVAQSTNRNLGTAGVSRVVTYELGQINGSGRFVALGGGAIPDAVEVTATATVDYFFRPGTGTTTRRAVASRRPQACFSIGSFAVNLSTQKSALLNGMLNDALNLSLVSYTGLATASVSLFDLAAQMGFGSVEQLLAANVTYSNLALATADVLERQGDVANATVLRSIGTSVTALTVSLGNVVSVAPTSDAAAETRVNVLDLIAGSAFLANGTNSLAVPGLTVSVPPSIMNLTTSIHVTQPPQPACGGIGAYAETAQIDLTASGTIVNVPLAIPLVGTVNVQVGPLNLNLATAFAGGTLAAIVCGTLAGTPTLAAPNGIDVSVVTSLLQAGISIPIRVTGNVTLVGLVGLINVDIQATMGASTSRPTATTTATFRMPPDAFDAKKETGSNTVGLSGLGVTTSGLLVTARTLLGLAVSLTPTQIASILTPVTNDIVNPLITSVDNALLGPLTDLFGLNVAGADVFWRSIACRSPNLVG
ncbi:MAG: hypothetical protein M3527_02730 [Actinomycetota bacterium]|nr:hypothetical protein [Acidimicrobiia bacterium]MDQ3293354.1 hypothetical protein [Actinomycetota bacterium]